MITYENPPLPCDNCNEIINMTNLDVVNEIQVECPNCGNIIKIKKDS